MKIKELYLKGFGKFKDKKAVLGDRLNIIYGDNEAGKSTLHSFIEGMFFGFVKPDVRRRILLESYDRYRPWTGEFYEGYMIYEINSRRYRIERDFIKGRERLRILDDLTGDDITSNFKYDKNTREYLFVEQHLGINYTVFNNTISIGQLQARNDGDRMVREIGTQLSNLSTAGDTEISVSGAERLLKEVQGIIGTRKSYTKEYGRLAGRKSELEETLKVARQKVKELRKLQQQLKDAGKSMEETLKRRQQIEEGIKHIEGAAFLQRWKDIKALKEEEAKLEQETEVLAAYRDFPAGCCEEFAILEGIVKNEREEIRLLQQKIGDICHDIEARQAQTDGEFDDCIWEEKRMEAAQIFSVYRTLKSREEQLTSELEEVIAHLENLKMIDLPWREDLNKVEELNDLINSIQKEIQDADYITLRMRKTIMEKELRKVWGRYMLSAALVVLSFSLGIFVEPLLYGLGILGLGMCIYSHRILHSIKVQKQQADEAARQFRAKNRQKEEQIQLYREQSEAIFFRWGTDSINGIREKAVEYRLIEVKIQRLEDRIEDRNRELDRVCSEILKAREQLDTLLGEIGIPLEGEVGYTHIHELNRQMEERRRQKEVLVVMKSKLKDLEADLEKRNHFLDRKEERIACLLSKAGVDSAKEFKLGKQRYDEYINTYTRLKEIRHLLEGKLGGEPLDVVKSKAEEFIKDDVTVKRTAERIHLSEIKSELPEIDKTQKQIIGSIEKIRGSIQILQKDLISPADLEEELGRVNQRLAVLEQEREAAGIALECVREASAEVHREFAPILNEKVGEMVERITNGRYSQIRVTKDLQIYTVSPETRRQIKADYLSGGTLDQFYFSCRMAVAELISGRSDLPLILDDSFVQYDKGRLKNIMEYLVDISEDRQILLFTCHHRDREVVERLGKEFSYLEI